MKEEREKLAASLNERRQQTQALELAEDTLGKDLLAALMQEVKVLPDVWQKLNEEQQGNSIDRMRRQVEALVVKTIGILSAKSMVQVAADIESIAIKDGTKAVLKISGRNTHDSMNQLYESVGQGVFVTLANVEQFLGGMDDVKPEPDQRGLGLGHEYGPD
jgi:gamma-glutamyl phosphate reductase